MNSTDSQLTYILDMPFDVVDVMTAPSEVRRYFHLQHTSFEDTAESKRFFLQLALRKELQALEAKVGLGLMPQMERLAELLHPELRRR